MVAGAVLLIWTSLLETIVVGSLLVSLAVLVWLPPETLAVLVKLAAAVWVTFKLMVMSGYVAPNPSASLRVHVTV